MKLKKIKYLAFAGLTAAVLSACGGGACTPSPAPSDLTLTISASSQYPAGVAVTAYLTMTNTSKVNASNLVYTVPAIGESGNYTGVTITPDAGIGSNSEACTNIAAGASCTFTASIPANSHPGSFTVIAAPSGTASSNTKTTNSTKSLQAGSISVTANLGLVDIPNTQNQYYILPNNQTITAQANESSAVMLSVWVKQASAGLNSLHLVDETGAALSFSAVGTPSYAVNSVNTYRVMIPAGKTLQHIQAFGYNNDTSVCETLNIGTNNNTACSNDADINLATQGNGILSIEPSQFNMSESYASQVISLTNTGTGDVSSIAYPTWAALGQGQFSITNNNCSSLTKLSAGQSCTMTLAYTANTTSSQITPSFSYDDDNNAGTAPKNTGITIPYVGSVVMPFSVLDVNPNSVSLTPDSSRRVITITNLAGGSTAGVTISDWALPVLPAPLELEGSDCYQYVGAQFAPVKPLAVGQSCTYTIKYKSAESAGQSILPFTYNNGINAGQISNLNVDWLSKQALVVLVAVGTNGTILYSRDGASWESASLGTSDYLNGVTFADNKFVAVGSNGAIYTSADGINWESQNSTTTQELFETAYGNSTFVTVGCNGTVLTSPNAISWAQSSTPSYCDLYSVTYGNGYFVTTGQYDGGSSTNIFTSADGITWAAQTTPINDELTAVTYGGTKYVAVGLNGTIVYATESNNWVSAVDSGNIAEQLAAVIYADNKYIALARTGGIILNSNDADSWSSVSTSNVNLMYGLAYGVNQFYAVGGNGTILTSPDGIAWDTVPPITSEALYAIAYRSSND